jgi:hypothetical protein
LALHVDRSRDEEETNTRILRRIWIRFKAHQWVPTYWPCLLMPEFGKRADGCQQPCPGPSRELDEI